MADPELTPAQEALARELEANLQGKMGGVFDPFSPYSPKFRAQLDAAKKEYDKGNDPATAKLTAEGLKRAMENMDKKIPGFTQQRINAINQLAKGGASPATMAQPVSQGSGAGKKTVTQTTTKIKEPTGKVTEKSQVTVSSAPNKSSLKTPTTSKNPPLSPVPPQDGTIAEQVYKYTDTMGIVRHSLTPPDPSTVAPNTAVTPLIRYSDMRGNIISYSNPQTENSVGTTLDFSEGAAIVGGGRPSTQPPPPPPSPPPQRFDPLPPAKPINAVTPAQMPNIPDSRYTNTKGLPHDSNTAERNVDTTIKAMSPIPSQFQTAQAAVIQQRLRQIEDLQQMEQGFTDQYEPQTNLSPLLSWIGSQLGRDYLKGYTPPMTLQDVMTFQEKLAANTNKARGGLADSQMDYLKARMLMQDKQSMGESIKDTYATQTQKNNNGLADERLNLAKNQTVDGNNKTYKQMEGDYIKAYGNMQGNVGEAYRAMEDLVQYMNNYTGSRNVKDSQIKDPTLASILARFKSNISRLTIQDNVYISKLGALAKDDIAIIEKVIGASARSETIATLFSATNKFTSGQVLNTLKIYAKAMSNAARQKHRDAMTYTTPETREFANTDWQEYIASEDRAYQNLREYTPSQLERAREKLKELKKEGKKT